MNNKILILAFLSLIILCTIGGVYATDIDNLTLTVDISSEIEGIPVDDASFESGESEIVITDDNYDNYFNKYTGTIKDTLNPSVNTIKMGNVSNKAFIIDRPLNIMPLSSDCSIFV